MLVLLFKKHSKYSVDHFGILMVSQHSTVDKREVILRVFTKHECFLLYIINEQIVSIKIKSK